MGTTLNILIGMHGLNILFLLGIFSIGTLWFQLRCIWVESLEENINDM